MKTLLDINIPITAPVYLIDHHHLALPLRTKRLRDNEQIPWTVIHIDQHSDMRENEHIFDVDHIQNDQYIEDFAINLCTVGNFIPPLLNAWILAHCEQIRSERKLLNYETEVEPRYLDAPYILDIDLDYRAPEMSIGEYEQTLANTRQLLRKASFVTIATSPGFIDQELALKVLDNLLGM